MKQKKSKLTWAAISAAAALMLTGCSGSTEESESPAETTTITTATETTTAVETTAATTTDPDDLLPIIGNESEGENVFAVHLTNGTGMPIVGFAISAGEDVEFSDNLLENDDAFAADEERILYYDATEALSKNEANGTVYAIELTFEDETTAVLHQFPFGDIEDGTIKIEAAMAYLEYTSLESKDTVSTKEIEAARIEEEKEAEARQAEQKAAEQALAEEKQAAEEAARAEEAQQNYNDETPAEEATAAAADAPVVDDTPQEAADPNDGCLGDEGLFY